MENQRLFLAIALSVLVIAVSQVLFPPPKPPPRPSSSATVAATSDPAAPAPAPVATDSTTLTSSPSGEQIEVRTGLYRARFDTVGAVQTSMELLRYPESQRPDSAPVDVAQRHSPGRGLFPLDLLSGSQRVSTARVVFEPDRRILDIEPGGSGELVFRGEYPGWAKIEKTYRFHDGRYDIDVETRVTPYPGSRVDRAILSLSDSREVPESSHQDQLRARISWGLDRVHMDSVSVPDLRSEVRKGKHTPRVYDEAHGKGAIRWGGFDERYFLLAILPDLASGANAQLTALPDARTVQLDVVFPVPANAAETGGALVKARAFGGPKDLVVLRATENTLDTVLDYGRFALLSRAFVSILRFFHQFTGNWGFAIIILTLAVRLLLLPLNVSSFRSMKKMQALQPEMTQLREQHKDDPMKMQQEMGRLYKRYNVNPLGGCLPMLLQFPVFLGLYYALAQAIELRHAHFAFWIHDLSERDPYFVTPIIMGVTMFVQQLLTPMAGDPAQQKMMRLMPVIFTVSFLNFPSGLVLYWLFSNLVGIASQWYIKRSPA
ncbi:MAG: membrane protein insertase YidC [Deltaproteobacteria bacterium]|nr:membrane protein insertase YidC [Deltaproteobacteria bacterium]